MSFTSPEFVIFFCAVLPLYFVLPGRFRWVLLLVASYVFYAFANVYYLSLIVFSTLVDYTVARLLGVTENQRRRTLLLALSIIVNLGVLATFKYFNWFNQSLGTGITALGGSYDPFFLDVILPVGISFYTFQSMAYTIDVYRRKIEPEKHFGIMATFIAFFPQLVAGPIERAGNMLPQFHQTFRFDYDRVVTGLRLILWGFFKKIVIADRMAIYVNTVYNDLPAHDGAQMMLATIFFAFQIYCDFSAYSDIAIGTAQIMGFRLMENFRQPYFSRSVREFWSRWHISLSTWFRDYVYIPLGGSRVRMPRHLLNLMIVFVVSGLWHGAGWTFVIWGALHGIYVVVGAWLRHRDVKLLANLSPLVGSAVSIGATFVLVNFAWVFFRANSLSDALYVLQNLFVFRAADLTAPFAEGLLGARAEFGLALGLIALLLVVDTLIARYGFDKLFTVSPRLVRWSLYYAQAAAVIFSGLYGVGAQEFIYFQF